MIAREGCGTLGRAVASARPEGAVTPGMTSIERAGEGEGAAAGGAGRSWSPAFEWLAPAVKSSSWPALLPMSGPPAEADPDKTPRCNSTERSSPNTRCLRTTSAKVLANEGRRTNMATDQRVSSARTPAVDRFFCGTGLHFPSTGPTDAYARTGPAVPGIMPNRCDAVPRCPTDRFNTRRTAASLVARSSSA